MPSQNTISFSVPDALRIAGTYKTVESVEALKKLVKQAQKEGIVSIDFECDSLSARTAKILGFSLS
jgi:hypothetical protein